MMDTETSNHCEGEENLDMMPSIMEEQEKLKVEAPILCLLVSDLPPALILRKTVLFLY